MRFLLSEAPLYEGISGPEWACNSLPFPWKTPYAPSALLNVGPEIIHLRVIADKPSKLAVWLIDS